MQYNKCIWTHWPFANTVAFFPLVLADENISRKMMLENYGQRFGEIKMNLYACKIKQNKQIYAKQWMEAANI